MSLATTVRTDLDVYGLGVTVAGDWPEVVEAVELDFAWFRAPEPHATPDLEVSVERAAPDFDAFGPLPATFVTPRNVVHQDGDRTVVDYFGQAVSVLDRRTGRLAGQGEESHLVHEAAYQYLTSRIGEHLDARGLTRLHSMGLVGAAGAVAVMLPSGGGKSTLALRALEDERVRLLSEDTPLIDARGFLHPFPLRIGVNATDAARLPEHAVRRIERMEFHPKLVLELSAFEHRIAREPAPLAHIVLGRRTLGREARLERLPRRVAAGTLFREAVVGVGVYQGMEFVLQRGMRDVLGKAGTAWGRASRCTAGLRRAEVWRLTLGRDHEANYAALAPLLHERP
jgi:hypothetical protein